MNIKNRIYAFCALGALGVAAIIGGQAIDATPAVEVAAPVVTEVAPADEAVVIAAPGAEAFFADIGTVGTAATPDDATPLGSSSILGQYCGGKIEYPMPSSGPIACCHKDCAMCSNWAWWSGYRASDRKLSFVPKGWKYTVYKCLPKGSVRTYGGYGVKDLNWGCGVGPCVYN